MLGVGIALGSLGTMLSELGALPVNTVAPAISGTPRIGQELTVSTGSWDGDTPIAYGYQWRRDGAAIAGATSAAYTIQAGDDMAEITVLVTATNDVGSAEAETAPVTATYPAPVAAGALEDQTFDEGTGVETYATAGDFTGQALTYALVAPPGGVTIAAGTGVVSVDTGQTGTLAGASIVVRATNSGGAADSGFSLTVEAVAEPVAPSNTSLPAITGTPEIGEELTASAGTWTGDAPIAYAYQWRRDGNDIEGAAAATYTLVAADDQTDISVEVTATNAAGSAAAASAATAVTYAAPSAAGALADRTYAEDSGAKTYATAGDFTGGGLSFSLPTAPTGVSIAPGTGVVTIDTAATGLLSEASVVVRATNSGGTADSAFSVTVAEASATEFAVAADATRANIIPASAYQRIDTVAPAGATLCGCDPDAWHAGTDLADAVVLHVTTTADDPDTENPIVGSLRWALRTTTLADGVTPITGATVIAFDVSGECELFEIVRLMRPNTFIAGQTAPVAAGGSGGFTIKGRPLKIEASNCRVEHVRSRPGTVTNPGVADTQDGITIDVTGGVNDIYLKNVSVSHTIDELLSSRPGASGAQNRRISVIDCLLAEPLKNPTNRHEDNHNFGMYWRRGTQEYEFARNIIAGTRRRSPALEQKTSGVVASNYVYDNGSSSPLIFLVKGSINDDETIPVDPGQGQSEILCTAVHNLFCRGAEDAAAGYNPDGDFCEPQLLADDKWVKDPTHGPVRLFQSHNHILDTPGGTAYPEPRNDSTAWQIILDTPNMWGRAQVIPWDQVQSFTLAHAGAWPGDRDACDTRIIAAITAGTLTAPTAPPADDPTPAASGAWSAPADPFTFAANGRLVITNALEALNEGLGGAPDTFVDQDVLATFGGVVNLQSDGDVEFDPAGYFDAIYTDEGWTVQIAAADIDGSDQDMLSVTVTGALTPPTPADSSTLRGLYSLGTSGVALDFVTGEAAKGAANIALSRQIENLGRGSRTFVNDAGALETTVGPRLNDNGLLMTSLYLNPRGPSGESEFFTESGGTNWYTTYFDRELQSVANPIGGAQSVHCSMDRDSRSTMSTNDYDLPGGDAKMMLSVWLKRASEVSTPDEVYVPIMETGSDAALAFGGNGRAQYWVGPVTDEWQWFHVPFTDGGNSDQSVGFSRNAAGVVPTEYWPSASPPDFVSDTLTDSAANGGDEDGKQLCRFFHAFGMEVRTQDTVPNCYAGQNGAYPDRPRLTGDALAQATALKDACTITVIGRGGGGNTDILAEDGDTGVRIGFVAGELAIKSTAGNVLSGVSPAGTDEWEVKVVLDGEDASIQVDGGTVVSGTANVSMRSGPLRNVGRNGYRSDEIRDMAVRRIVIEP